MSCSEQGVALVLALVLADVPTAGAQKRGRTLRVAYGNEISNFDFHTAPVTRWCGPC